jgi:hypothetical protein
MLVGMRGQRVTLPMRARWSACRETARSACGLAQSEFAPSPAMAWVPLNLSEWYSGTAGTASSASSLIPGAAAISPDGRGATPVGTWPPLCSLGAPPCGRLPLLDQRLSLLSAQSGSTGAASASPRRLRRPSHRQGPWPLGPSARVRSSALPTLSLVTRERLRGAPVNLTRGARIADNLLPVCAAALSVRSSLGVGPVRRAVQQDRRRSASLCRDGTPAPGDTKGSSSRWEEIGQCIDGGSSGSWRCAL